MPRIWIVQLDVISSVKATTICEFFCKIKPGSSAKKQIQLVNLFFNIMCLFLAVPPKCKNLCRSLTSSSSRWIGGAVNVFYEQRDAKYIVKYGLNHKANCRIIKKLSLLIYKSSTDWWQSAFLAYVFQVKYKLNFTFCVIVFGNLEKNYFTGVSRTLKDYRKKIFWMLVLWNN